MLRVCRSLLPAADADDAWSETFLAALRAYPDLPAGANTEAWLVRIATNKAIDQTRARARRPVPSASVADPDPAGRTPAGRTPDGRTPAGRTFAGEPVAPGPDADEPHDAVREAVAALPDKQRLAVSLHYLGGLPYALVAEQLGGTPEAARRAAADGVARLRTRFLASGAPR